MSERRYYNFDSFRIDPIERVLLRDDKPVSLSPKVFDTLLALVQHSGHIVSKDELVEIVWPDTFVEENNLTQYVAAARRALGDNRQEQRYIETIPKRGYRFAPSVRLITEDSDSVLIGVCERRSGWKRRGGGAYPEVFAACGLAGGSFGAAR